MQKALGPVYTVLKNKYYFDELYTIHIHPTGHLVSDMFANAMDLEGDRWVSPCDCKLVGVIGDVPAQLLLTSQ